MIIILTFVDIIWFRLDVTFCLAVGVLSDAVWRNLSITGKHIWYLGLLEHFKQF